MQGDRVIVTDDAIEVFHAESRFGQAWTSTWLWAELHSVAVGALHLAPDDERWVFLDVSHVNGEFAQIDHQTEGFSAAVAEVARRGGSAVPDLAALNDNEWVEIWHMNVA